MKESNNKRAVIYCRVSSEEQAKGYSIPAQRDLCREYAHRNGLIIVQEPYEDIESASKAGRPRFGAMLAYARKHPGLHIIAEKTDRLLRNRHDEYAMWGLIEDSGAWVHRTKEGFVHNDSPPAAKLMFRVHNMLASHDTDDRKDKTRKGLRQKALEGYRPGGNAPLGYKMGTIEGRNCIVPDSQIAPLIVRLFETYRAGTYSLKSILPVAHSWGLRTRRGKKLGKQMIYKLLSNPVYTGKFLYNGKLYDGKHEALIPESLFREVDALLHHRRGKMQFRKHLFALSGVIRCGHCNRLMTAQHQRGKNGKGDYVYYRCAAYCPGEKYIREERLMDDFAAMLGGLEFDEETMDIIAQRLREAKGDQEEFRAETIARLRKQHDSLQTKIDRLARAEVDAVADGIDSSAYRERIRDIQRERDEVQEQLTAVDAADDDFTEQIITLARIARRAADIFLNQEGSRRVAFLRGVILNPTFANGTLKADFAQPFDMIRDAVGTGTVKATSADAISGESKSLGGRRDLNPQPLVPQTSALTN